MKSRYMVISPGGILLPGKSFISKILLRVQTACFHSDSRDHRLQHRARTPDLTKTVIHWLFYILIQILPLSIRKSQNKIIIIIGRSAYKSQNFSRIRIYCHRTAGILLKFFIKGLLQAAVNGKLNVLSVFS